MGDEVDLVDRKAILAAIAEHNAKYDDMHLHCLWTCIPQAVQNVPSYKLEELANDEGS